MWELYDNKVDPDYSKLDKRLKEVTDKHNSENDGNNMTVSEMREEFMTFLTNAYPKIYAKMMKDKKKKKE